MDESLQEFVVETRESLGALDLELLRLEKNPKDKELINRVFRLVHTVKGNCGFLNLPRLENVTHHTETILGRYRSGALEVTPDSASLLLQSLDRIKAIVAGLAETGQEPKGDDKPLLALLDLATLTATPASGIAVLPPPAPVEDIAASVRLSLATLENILSSVSELVLTRNQILQGAGTATLELKAHIARLNRAVSGLQEDVMRARLQPLQAAFAKLPRMVRDLAADLGKKIKLELEGEDTEIDRQVLDLIRDPLTHLVRNAADHGLEKPAARIAAGKHAEGRICVRAHHEGGQVVIIIEDDGQGLDPAAIGRKALEKGIVTLDALRGMNERQVRQLIFTAGFSTAQAVTAVSGRGVGLDVVRANIEKIGGTVDISSEVGKGTQFTLRIPLTVAIVPALILSVGGTPYAIAQSQVREVLRLRRNGPQRIEDVGDEKFLRLRGTLIPLVSLQSALGLDATDADTRQGCVIILGEGRQAYGVIVDGVHSTEEIVVRPVLSLLSQQRLYSGCSVLGDGCVVLILDPAGIAAAGGIDLARVTEEKPQAPVDTGPPPQPLLLFRESGHNYALPLRQVWRLEKIDMSTVSEVGGLIVTEYRGRLLPLCFLHGRPAGRAKMLVLQEDAVPRAGLVIEEVTDILSARIDDGAGEGILGTAVINTRAIPVLDASVCIQQARGKNA